jgi:phosphoribosyl-ATP pyrophosphohydrolase
MYYIYHVFGKKIGVTRNINYRLKTRQGYHPTEYEILEESNDIDYISQRELELQSLYGYEQDIELYKTTIKNRDQMVLNVTEQTTTFPCPLNKLKGNLMDNKQLKIETEFGKYALTEDLIDWIVKNANTSMYNPGRSYVYNKAMNEFAKSMGKKTPAMEYKDQYSKSPDNSHFDPGNVYDLIRLWAETRGIYKDGDAKTQYVKLMEESGELARAILKNDKPELIDAIGDMMVVLTNLAALEGLKVEDCVVSAYQVIESRKGKMINGSFVKETL